MPTATEERPAARSRRPARKADPPATSTKVQSGELPHLYEYGMVPVSKLFIDPDYQRELTPLAGQIERDFDPHMFIPLLVSARRGGKFAVFDGQHRYVGARDKGFEEVPCLVYRNLSPEQEATLFSRLQRERRGIKATDRFKAELHGDPERPETKMAIDIEKIAEQRGFTVGSTSEAEGLLKIASPTALEQTYRAKKGDMTGPEALAAALTTIKGVWPTEKRNTDSDLIRGLGLLFIKHGKKLDTDRLIDKLGEVTPTTLLARANDERTGRGGGGAAYAMYRVLVGQYNKGGGKRLRYLKRAA